MPSRAAESDGHSVASAHLDRGLGLRARHCDDEAIAELRAACRAEPGLAEAHHQLGNALKGVRRYAEAAESLRAAVRLAPGSAAIWLNLGGACLELRQLDEAVASFHRALAIEPLRPEAHNILGHALLEQGRCAEAGRSLAEALRLRPGYPAAHDNLGRVYKAQGRPVEAVAQHRAALAGKPRPETHSNLLYSINFLPELSPDAAAAEHRLWARTYEEPLRDLRLPFDGDLAPSRRLRVGYVSPDFVNHAVAYFFAPVLAAHDREGIETTCYSDARSPDAVTRRLETHAGRWRDIAGWSDARVAEAVRRDRIDILVDLAGHTARNRLLVFAQKPAPVQVTWLGYPTTTGLESMDYRVTEAVSDPPGQTEAWHSEELVRLPGPFSCYEPCPASPPVGPLPAESAGCVTFGCFNNLAKVNDRVIEVWAKLLADIPGSRLMLVSRGLSDPETCDRVRRIFGGLGVAPARLDLGGNALPEALHLARYHRVDIALDTFPYNGATTTCEALWMGVPVVALAGRTHASRVGASMLTHLGAPEWVGSSPSEYAAICLRLADDLPGLSAVRRDLRGRMSRSPLCDAQGFTKNLEDAFRAMWLRFCKKNSPRVPPAWAPANGASADGIGANQNNAT
jgi:predicted O-linked N-acetylglucosamine transferase (SPINDLY family)